MPNRLAGETSPYLLQHANNPVQWYPWCPEALDRSRKSQLPIFLSIGYSACHWCHVMEHESFEDEAIANLLNERFVSIKVDREERPDLDQIYMTAVQMLTGHGGWPMSVFLTPDLKPFFAGTYWPPRDRAGMPGFLRVVEAVDDAWQHRREQAIEQSAQIADRLLEMVSLDHQSALAHDELLRNAVAKSEQDFDAIYGGFGGAPKFPQPLQLQVLLRAWNRWPHDGVLNMVTLTLDKMARGGLYDHLAGGFARYSVDERWLVPHFEKMLYDNALLADAYLDAYLVTNESRLATVVRETLDYVLTYMIDEQGGFHSTEDADSEGQEGKFYVWSASEVHSILAERAERFCEVYDVTDSGNFEGQNILNLPRSLEQCALLRGWDVDELAAEMKTCRQQLLQARNQRVRPAKDDKIIVSWNGLMIHALARAAAALDRPEYLQAATKAAAFIRHTMLNDQGRLRHVWRQGQAKFNAYLDDYACYGNSLVSLYEAGLEETWIDVAARLADVIMGQFRDRQGEGFFFTSDDHEALIARTKDQQDSSVPSGSGMAATFLLRLGKLCGRHDYVSAARSAIANAGRMMEQIPSAASQMLIASDIDHGPTPEIVVLGDPRGKATATILGDLHRRYVPNRVLACRARPDREDGAASLDPIFLGKQKTPGVAVSVYLCEDFTCQTPVHDDQILELWKRLSVR